MELAQRVVLPTPIRNRLLFSSLFTPQWNLSHVHHYRNVICNWVSCGVVGARVGYNNVGMDVSPNIRQAKNPSICHWI